MKIASYAIVLFALAMGSCNNPQIGSTAKFGDLQLSEAEEKHLDSLRQLATAPAPVVVTPNLIIQSKEDLMGYWVGWFEAHESNLPTDENGNLIYDEELEGDFWENEYSSNSNKINLSIDSIRGDDVYGHSVVAGNNRPFKGSVLETDTSFQFAVNEPGDDPYDGKFEFHIAKNDSLMKGDWYAFREMKIKHRYYSLEKKIYAYDPNASLGDWPYIDWTKQKTKMVEYGDGEKYEQEQLAASTEASWTINASNTLLKKEDVENLSKGDLFVLRNSIFARHGYSFKAKPLRNFFDNQEWYIPTQTDVRHELTDIEIKNIELLLRYEEHAQEYYDYFGR